MRVSISFVLQAVAAGIAAALVLLVFFPDIMRDTAIVRFARVPVPVQQEGAAATAPGEGPVSYSRAVTRAAPAVVNIYTTREAGDSDSIVQPAERAPFPGTLDTTLGSGVILSDQGHVLTNNHLIRGATRINVMLRDSRSAEATVVGTDPETDLAVLKVDLPGLPALTLAHGNPPLRVGDVVLAIGNPFGVGQTVTMGIVSATGRDRLGINTFEDFIQTDAAINPGNSGGALVDAFGRLVGINTAIVSGTGGSQGIGFAIPIALATDVMAQIIENGYVARGWLGIEVLGLNEERATTFGVDPIPGIIVAGVVPDSPGEQAGLQTGDVITHLNEEVVTDTREAINFVASRAPGQQLRLSIVRNGRTNDVTVTVAERPRARAGG